MSIRKRVTAFAAFVSLSLLGLAAVADERAYSDGPVVSVAGYRTEYGRFDDYMKFLATSWKQEQEAAKKAGLILAYNVYTLEPRGLDDPDVLLVITFKNWAALDNVRQKAQALAKEVYGSTTVANQGAVERGNMRRKLGSVTLQEIILK
jgi:hypothetical protein